MAKQTIMDVHANPNTHPGGVQGALSKFWYQSDETPSPVNSPPMPKAVKFRTRNNRILLTIIVR
jgi:hypothetical protein